jgi:hypothetical protein
MKLSAGFEKGNISILTYLGNNLRDNTNILQYNQINEKLEELLEHENSLH